MRSTNVRQDAKLTRPPISASSTCA